MIYKNADITSEFEGGVLKLKIIGEIDHHSARCVREKADKEIFLYRPQMLELDLSEVNFMDSSGLGIIMGRRECAASVGCEMRLINPCRRVERILSLAGIERLIEIKHKKCGGK